MIGWSKTNFSFSAIGTHWQIDLADDLNSESSAILLVAIKKLIAGFDFHYSRFRDDSLVAQMARAAGTYQLPADARPMLDIYRQAYDLTDGLVSPLIGQTLVDAGYDAAYSLQTKNPTTPPAWDEVLDLSQPGKLTIKQPWLLDFGAAGKGYLIDLVCELILKHGYSNFCVEAGGDLRFCPAVISAPTATSGGILNLKVGLENPADFSQAIGILNLTNGSLCGSAGNRRAWGRFHHIINPKTVSSPHSLAAVWVKAADTLTADILTTCLFFAEPKKLLPQFTFDYFLLKPDFTFTKSDNFNAELFVN